MPCAGGTATSEPGPGFESPPGPGPPAPGPGCRRRPGELCFTTWLTRSHGPVCLSGPRLLVTVTSQGDGRCHRDGHRDRDGRPQQSGWRGPASARPGGTAAGAQASVTDSESHSASSGLPVPAGGPRLPLLVAQQPRPGYPGSAVRRQGRALPWTLTHDTVTRRRGAAGDRAAPGGLLQILLATVTSH